jgi:hypothetical protein
MPRAYPSAFENKDTYGVNTDLDRDRLPVLDQTSKCSFKDIIVADRQLPIRLCLAALPYANDAEDVAKLVIGAVLNASGVSATAARLVSPYTRIDIEAIKNWANPRAYPESFPPATEIPEAVEGETAPVSTQPAPFPRDSLPEWLADLEFTDDDFIKAWAADDFEIAAYAGVLAFCIAKQPDSENLQAFNQKRRNAVEQYMTHGPLDIFIDESPALTLEILGKVHRTFNSIIRDRAIIFGAVVARDEDLVSGTIRMFYVIFRLSSGSSLNPLLIITRFARKYPTFYREFPDLETEYHAAAHALQRFYDANEKNRMYLKVIFGSAYVPVNRSDINSLLGVAVFTLQQSESTLSNYRGGVLSVAHRQKLLRLLEIADAAEEDVPEEVTT